MSELTTKQYGDLLDRLNVDWNRSLRNVGHLQTIYLGSPFVGSIVVTTSPRKSLYRNVSWFDVRVMTLRNVKAMSLDFSDRGDNVFFNCFDETAVIVSDKMTGHRDTSEEEANFDGEFWSGDDR